MRVAGTHANDHRGALDMGGMMVLQKGSPEHIRLAEIGALIITYALYCTEWVKARSEPRPPPVTAVTDESSVAKKSTEHRRDFSRAVSRKSINLYIGREL